uniref:Uncharacterized protein n=1 Tax=Arundo donax TaxID=35708 RepID=A0A0A9C0E4_ARUDO
MLNQSFKIHQYQR